MKSRSDYFYIVFWILLVLVFIGFAPSFYLKPFLPEHPFYPDGLSIPHVLHGIILSVWFVFLVVQAGFIKYRKIHIHRKLGWFGAFWSLLVLISTIWIIIIFPERMQALAIQLNSTVDELEPGLSVILWMDIFMCTLFAGFIITGIWNRKVAEVHKRMMLFAGIVFMFAAVGRIGGLIDYLFNLQAGFITGNLILLSLTGSLLVHDYRTKGKILSVSWLCFCLFWVSMILGILFGSSDVGKAIVLGNMQ